MPTNYGFDAKRAYHHIAQLAFPRLVGSAGEAKAQDYIVQQFTALGLEVSRESFSFTKFPAEVLPRILCGLFLPVVLSVPLFGERFPIPVCLICLLSLSTTIYFTQWQKRLEGLYDVGPKHRSENIVATNGVKQADNTPTFLFVAHYDSKSQVLPIAVRAVAYGVSIVGLLGLTIATVVRIVFQFWLPAGLLWSIAGTTSFCLLLLQINLTQNRSPGGFDNASGVGVLLELARVAKAYHKKIQFTFLAAGAEEYGMCGALRYIQKHAHKHVSQDVSDELRKRTFMPDVLYRSIIEKKYNRDWTWVINLDGLGVSKDAVNLITRYGIPPVYTAKELSSALSVSGKALGIKVTERYFPIGVGFDSIPIASRGFEAVTLTSGDVGSVTLKVHSKQDRHELLNLDSLQQVGELIVDIIERTAAIERA